MRDSLTFVQSVSDNLEARAKEGLGPASKSRKGLWLFVGCLKPMRGCWQAISSDFTAVIVKPVESKK